MLVTHPHDRKYHFFPSSLFIIIEFIRKVNQKMKEKGSDQRCITTKVDMEENLEYMWPHQIEKTTMLDPEVRSLNKKLMSGNVSAEEASKTVSEFLCFSIDERVRFHMLRLNIHI